MYFWDVKKLTEDLKHNRVSAVEFKNYYIVLSLLLLAGQCLYSFSPAEESKMVLASLVIQVGLLLSWVNAMFHANGGQDGEMFLNRVISLSIPVTVKVSVYSTFIMITLKSIIELFGNTIGLSWSENGEQIFALLFELGLTCFIYWRIYVAIKRINT